LTEQLVALKTWTIASKTIQTNVKHLTSV